MVGSNADHSLTLVPYKEGVAVCHILGRREHVMRSRVVGAGENNRHGAWLCE